MWTTRGADDVCAHVWAACALYLIAYASCGVCTLHACATLVSRF